MTEKILPVKLVWNDSDCIAHKNNILVHAAPIEHPPFTVSAIMEEQDTHLLLQRPTTLIDPGKPAWYLANKLEQERIYNLGDIISSGKDPIRLLAIVHDIDRQPTCNLDDISTAYQNLLTTIELHHITSLGMPLLGTVHGQFSLETAMTAFRETMISHPCICLKKLWLILPEGASCECMSLLRTG